MTVKEQGQVALATRRKQLTLVSIAVLLLGFFICSVYIELSITSKTKQKEPSFSTVGRVSRIEQCDLSINVLVQFLHANNNMKLQVQIRNFLISLFSRTNCRLHLYIVIDAQGRDCIQNILSKISLDHAFQLPMINYVNSVDIKAKLPTLMRAVNEMFINGQDNSYYNRWFFFTSVALHRFFPLNVTRIIMLDIDMEFRSDIQKLYTFFNYMKPDNVIGLAREQQPVYAHVNTVYRENHDQTLVGAPPPNGMTGFNSGTILLNLKVMRNSVIYNRYIDNIQDLKSLIEKYNFKGHLGDQDFFTLLSFDNTELFYTLPCQWNRQLCQWWKNDGYKSIFDSYFNCTPPYHILHGNCDSPIPNQL